MPRIMNKFRFLTPITILLLSLMVCIGAMSCSERRQNWNPMYFTQMFRHRDIQGLIKGRVVRLFPPQHVPHLGDEVITAEIEVECVYRGGAALETMPLVNVTGFGHNDDCVDTNVVVDDTYLMFVEPFFHLPRARYAVQEFNLQKGAFTVSSLKMAIVTSVYECHKPVGLVATTLRPWRSLTPIKQLPWIIMPKDAKPLKAKSSGNRLGSSAYHHHLLLSFVIAVKLLSLS